MIAGGADLRAPAASARFSHIDGLRGIAALLVFTHHFLGGLVQTAGSPDVIGEALHWLQRTLDFGRMGVDLFFIVSGFVIGQSVCRYPADNVRMFVVARFFRLFPVYWLSVLVAVVVTGDLGTTRVLVNLTMLQGFVGVDHALGVYWTLTVELVFYVSSVALFWFGVLDRTRRLAWCFTGLVGFAVLAALVRYAMAIPVPFAWPMFLSLFVGGMLLRQLDDRGAAQGGAYGVVIGAYLLAALVIAIAVYHDPSRYQKTWIAEFGSTAGAVLMFVLVLRFKPRLRILALVGVISYSVYLFHAPSGDIVLRILTEHGGPTLPWPVGFLVILIAVLAFSTATYRLVERPAIQWGRRIQRRIGSRPLAAEPLRMRSAPP